MALMVAALAGAAPPVQAAPRAAAAAPAAVQDAARAVQVVPGVEYLQLRREDGPQSIHVVKVELARDELAVRVALGGGVVLGRQTVAGMVSAWPPEQGRPLAAVNGDYFETGRANPRYAGALQGIHITGGELVHGPLGHALWFDAHGRPHFHPAVHERFVFTWPDGSQTPFRINGSTTAQRSEVSGADVVLFTPAFGDSTRTDEGGLELVLELAADQPADGPPDQHAAAAALPLRADRSYTATVRALSRRGNTPIPPDAAVLSIVAEAAAKLAPLAAGDRLGFTTALEPGLGAAVEAIGGGPPLLAGGKPHPAGQDRQNVHPRTAIGFSGTHLFLVVVDGRQPDLSVGMSLGELGELMVSLGCTDALNLDGGGSSTLWLDGAVVNSPSDPAGPRPVANALLIVQTAPAAR